MVILACLHIVGVMHGVDFIYKLHNYTYVLLLCLLLGPWCFSTVGEFQLVTKIRIVATKIPIVATPEVYWNTEIFIEGKSPFISTLQWRIENWMPRFDEIHQFTY